MTYAVVAYAAGVAICLVLQLTMLNGEDMKNCTICGGKCEAAGWLLTVLVAVTWPILLAITLTPAWRNR